MSSFVRQIQFERLMWFVALFVGLLIMTLVLTTGNFLIILLLGGLGWLIALPYHGRLAIILGITSFGSALILPFFPGRPFLWEFAALLGWSGMVTALALRRQAADFSKQLRLHRTALMGVVGYVAVLGLLISIRGTGLQVLGSEQMGGRVYFQQIACAIFPFLFLAIPLTAGQILGLFTLQCLLSMTFLISDLVLTTGVGGKLWFLLYFLGLANDSLSFEAQAQMSGLRRYQSLVIVGQAFIYLLLSRVNVARFFSRSGFWLLPLGTILFAVSAAAGHRGFLFLMPLTLIGCMYGQRFLTAARVFASLVTVALFLFVAYNFSREMPLPMQRTLSLLPGINIDSLAAEDGLATFDGRRVMRSVGWQIAPNYHWIGRGFGLNKDVVQSPEYDPYGFVRESMELGRFFNGFIGLLVNTGIPGLFFCSLFLLGTSSLALKVLRHLRAYGCEDNLARLCCVLASNWLSSVLFFYVLHGDSEFAMRTFALQAGLLMACARLRFQAFADVPAAM